MGRKPGAMSDACVGMLFVRRLPAWLTRISHHGVPLLAASSVRWVMGYAFTACKPGTDRRLVVAHCSATSLCGEKWRLTRWRR